MYLFVVVSWPCVVLQGGPFVRVPDPKCDRILAIIYVLRDERLQILSGMLRNWCSSQKRPAFDFDRPTMEEPSSVDPGVSSTQPSPSSSSVELGATFADRYSDVCGLLSTGVVEPSELCQLSALSGLCGGGNVGHLCGRLRCARRASLAVEVGRFVSSI